MTSTLSITALAAAALRNEGFDAYFPGLDATSFDAPGTLAQYCVENPYAWTAAKGEAWTFCGEPEDVTEFALSLGAEYAPVYEA
tara:strand:- start:866 stop:1117 length:252 start_codon:yes stop_codon:yes gene_type:complete